MLFRWAIGFGYLLFVVNPGLIVNLGRINPILKSTILLAALIYVFTRPVDKRVLVLLAVCLTMVVGLGALTSYPRFQWSILLGALNQILVPYLLLAGEPTEKDRSFFLKLSVWLAPIASGLGFAYAALGLYNPFPIEYATGEPRFAGTLNPAFLGGLATIGMFACFKLMERGSKAYAGMFIFNFVCLILSAGRMNLFVMVFTFVLSLLLSNVISRNAKIQLSLAGAVASLVLVPLVWLRYADRFTKSGDNGRDFMWDWLHSMSDRYPNFGIGFGHQFWSTPPELLAHFSSAAAHNDYLRLLVELGWFGVFAFYGLFIVTVLVVWSSKVGRRDYSIIVTLAGFLLLSSTDNALATTCYFTLIITAVMAAQPRVKKSVRAGVRRGYSTSGKGPMPPRQRPVPIVDSMRWPPVQTASTQPPE